MEANPAANLLDDCFGWAGRRAEANGPPVSSGSRGAIRERIEDLVLRLSRPSMFDGDGRPLTHRERLLI